VDQLLTSAAAVGEPLVGCGELGRLDHPGRDWYLERSDHPGQRDGLGRREEL
jgi:hypothetical protein